MRPAYAIAYALLLSGCGVLDFDVTQSIPPQMIPGDPVAAAAGQVVSGGGLLPNPVGVDVGAQIRAHGGGALDSAHLKTLTLTIDPNSPTQNFDWLDELHIQLASIKPGTTLAKVEIASATMIPKGQKTITLKLNASVNLLPYLNEGATIGADGSGRVTAQGVTFRGTVVIRISPV
jgi:hypothetical protein